MITDQSNKSVRHHTLNHPSGKSIEILGEELILHPQRYIFRVADRSIICSDIHIGKGEHFRKNGIAIPKLVNKNNFWKLSGAFEFYKPEKFIVLGDLVHSTLNHEWEDLKDFLDGYPDIQRLLIKGNHEIENDSEYVKLGFDVRTTLESGSFLFCHDPAEKNEKNLFMLCGHIHPAISLFGHGRQHLKVACYWQTSHSLILPSFGTFTGSHIIRPNKNDKVYAVTENEIIEIK